MAEKDTDEVEQTIEKDLVVTKYKMCAELCNSECFERQRWRFQLTTCAFPFFIAHFTVNFRTFLPQNEVHGDCHVLEAVAVYFVETFASAESDKTDRIMVKPLHRCWEARLSFHWFGGL